MSLGNKNNIMLFSYARTGSTKIIDYMRAYSNTSVCCEPFQGNEIGFSNKKEKLTSIWPGLESAAMFVDYVKSDPVRYLKELYNHMRSEKPGSTTCVKLFPAHCKLMGIDCLEKENGSWSNIIDMCNLGILLTRNPVDSYISYKKAVAVESWGCTNTTNIRIKFDTVEYTRLKNIRKKWLEQVSDSLTSRHIPIVKWTYETFPYNNQQHVKKCIDTEIGAYVPIGDLHVDHPVWASSGKQDQSFSYKNKIKNYNEVREFIDHEHTLYIS